MDELDYILANNLAFLTVLTNTMKHMMIFEDDPVIDAEEFKKVEQQFSIWLMKYHEHITGTKR